jgi:hypothetical protein
MDPSHSEAPGFAPGERPPLGQRVFDNMYLLLGLGLAVMLVVFTAWGMWEILSMPKGALP